MFAASPGQFRLISQNFPQAKLRLFCYDALGIEGYSHGRQEFECMGNTNSVNRRLRIGRGIGASLLLLCAISGCGRSPSNQVQGYVEGEFVYVASPFAGQLEVLAVSRGTQVKQGDLLFQLDSVPEKADRDEAERRLLQSRANLEDAKKGKRPTEIRSMEAQLKEARAALKLAEQEYTRQQKLVSSHATSVEDLERASSVLDQARQRVLQLEADLETAYLGLRTDQIAAAEADVHAREATLTRAEWSLSQKRQLAPQSGVIFDTIYYQGEWVAAGRPVVALLPPENIKVRAFVPEGQISTIHLGNPVEVRIDGLDRALPGKVSFISPQVEFTPPVIYSQESRGKLVVMIEVIFASDIAAGLHPGQPVDVRFGS